MFIKALVKKKISKLKISQQFSPVSGFAHMNQSYLVDSIVRNRRRKAQCFLCVIYEKMNKTDDDLRMQTDTDR